VVLLVVAFLTRRHVLPTDGLQYEDTAPAAGAKAASSLSQLFNVGIDHPGFSAILIAWHDLFGGSDASFTHPALIAGTLGPPLLYLALRGCGYERSISALLGAALAAVQTDIIYSGQIRSYTTDLLVVLCLAMIVPRLVRMRWRWQTGVAWAIAATLVASLAGLALVAAAVAGAIILLHPRSDFRVRAAAVATQAAASVALLVATSRSYNNAVARDAWRNNFDAYPDFHLNPFRLADEVFVHLRRLAETYPGGSSALAAVCIVAALIGLVTIVWKGRQAIRARYLLLLLGVVILGSLLGLIPFGPTQGNTQGSGTTNGSRISLWLIPVLAVGLAAALQGLRTLLPDRRTLRTGFDAAAYLAAAAILVSAVAADQPPYPSGGQKSAADFVQSHLGQRDAVLIGFRAHWSFAAESNLPYKVEPASWSAVGFVPEFTDPRVHYLFTIEEAASVDPRHVAPEVNHARRVFVYYENPPTVEWPPRVVPKLDSTLRKLGFEHQRTAGFGAASVEVWRRGQAAGAATAPSPKAKPKPKPQPGGGGQQPSPSQINLQLSDFPQGWKLAAQPKDSLAKHVFACLKVPGSNRPSTAMSATGPGQLKTISEVLGWPSVSEAQSATAAVRSSGDASRCVGFSPHFVTTDFGSGGSVSTSAIKVRAPAAAAKETVAYAMSYDSPNAAARGGLVVITRGRATAVILAYRPGVQSVPAKLLSGLAASAYERLGEAAPRNP
jgi:hypothetical protein